MLLEKLSLSHHLPPHLWRNGAQSGVCGRFLSVVACIAMVPFHFKACCYITVYTRDVTCMSMSLDTDRSNDGGPMDGWTDGSMC